MEINTLLRFSPRTSQAVLDVGLWAVNLEAKVAARTGSVFGDALQRGDWRRGEENLHPARQGELCRPTAAVPTRTHLG